MSERYAKRVVTARTLADEKYRAGYHVT